MDSGDPRAPAAPGHGDDFQWGMTAMEDDGGRHFFPGLAFSLIASADQYNLMVTITPREIKVLNFIVFRTFVKPSVTF